MRARVASTGRVDELLDLHDAAGWTPSYRTGVGVWLDGARHFGTRGQKARNLEVLPYAIAHIDSSDDVAMIAGKVTPVHDREGIRRILEAEHEKYGVEVTDEPGPFRYYRLEPEEGWAWLDNITVKVDAGEAARPLREPAPAPETQTSRP